MNLSGMPHAEMPENMVENNSFYPALSINELSEHYGVSGDYGGNIDIIIFAVSSAMLFVNDELSQYNALNWRDSPTLENVQSEQIDGTSRLITLYKQAVFSLAKAKLLISRLGETNRDQQAAQQQQANDNERYWRKASYDAIRQIMNESKNISVELL